MSEFKLVPVETIRDAMDALELYANDTLAGTHSANELRMLLSDVPAVQGEPASRGVPSRDDLIQCLLATHGQSEGITADAILSMLTTAPQPAEQKPRSDALIVEQTEKIAALLAKAFQGSQLTEGVTFRDCENPKAKQCWDVACQIQEGLTATDVENALAELEDDQQPAPNAPTPTFQLGDHVRKTKGSQWKGRVVGTYSTTLTPEGYAVESDTEKGSVQIYPVGALELVVEDVQQPAPDVSALVEALEEGLRAIGDHHAPDDCYATGPMTGDHFRDLVQCPACSFIAMCDDLLAAHRKQGGEV